METVKHVVGAAGEGLGEIEERIRLVREKVLRDAREIVEVLKLDFPKFIERQARERYTKAGSSFRLDAAALRAVKESVEAAGQRAVAELVPKLENWVLWLSPEAKVPAGGDRRTLSGNRAIQSTIAEIGGVLRGVLCEHGFPGADEDDYDDIYVLPSWFIAGRLLLSLVESYWRNLDELRGLEDVLLSTKAQGVEEQRAEDWDAA